MTETTKTVLEKYQVRKSRKQKDAFIEYVDLVAANGGYSCRVEAGSFGAKNIVVGDPDRAKVIYTAHYDTCAWMPVPNFLTPKNPLIWILYQLIFTFSLLGILFGAVLGLYFAFSALGLYPIAFLMLDLYMPLVWVAIIMIAVGPANRHTVNDNTSGVTVLLDTMNAMPPELRESVAFVFFDLEEQGLFGSMGFAARHKAAMKDKLLVNFDCVSDGEHMLIVVKRRARKFLPMLKAAYEENGSVSVQVAPRGAFYPSDQMNFPCGVGVAAFKKKLGTLYIDRIHTSFDTVYREENIDFLTAASVKLTSLL